MHQDQYRKTYHKQLADLFVNNEAVKLLPFILGQGRPDLSIEKGIDSTALNAARCKGWEDCISFMMGLAVAPTQKKELEATYGMTDKQMKDIKKENNS